MRRPSVRLIGAVCAVVLLASAALAWRRLRSAEAVLSLNFPDASVGLAPDGTPYDPYEICSDGVVRRANRGLSKSGMRIDAGSVTIRPSGVSGGMTIATDYVIGYEGAHADECLRALFDAYDAWFRENHTVTAGNLGYAPYPDDLGEPVLVADYLDAEAARIGRYAGYRMSQAPDWVPDADVSTFQSLRSRAQAISDVDVASFRAYVEEHGVSDDMDGLRGMFGYRQRLLARQLGLSDMSYSVRRDAITLYDSRLFPTVSVPSVSGGQYYIRTTKTGLDDVYDASSYYLEASLSLRKQMTDNDLVIGSMPEEATRVADSDAVRMAERIASKIDALAGDVRESDAAYVEETQGDLFSFEVM